MRTFLADFWDFLRAIFSTWQGWVNGGGVVGFVLIILVIWGKAMGKEMDNSLYFSIVLGAFIGAAFVAWREKHRALKVCEERVKSPDFKGKIEAVYHAETRWQEVLVLVEVRVVNSQGPATAVHDWRMVVQTNVKTHTGEAQTLLPLRDVLVSPGRLRFSSRDYAPDKMTQLLSAGSVSTGWFWSVFPDVLLGKLHDEGPMVVVSFCDAITGNRHYLKKCLTVEDRLRGQMTTIEKAE